VKLQRCWIHKERNLHAYLNRKDHGECSWLIDRIRKAEGAEDGQACYAELEKFLGGAISALKSLHEAGGLLTSMFSTCRPRSNQTFLSTNLMKT